MFLTDDLPGTGGALKVAPEDFRVEEIPAYEPEGAGEQVFVTVEKTGLSSMDAARRLARALGIRDRDIGMAGLKDRHAVTVQRMSLPPPVTPEAARQVAVEGLTVLDAARHRHKLKTGHLRGNRFVLRVRQTAVAAPEAAERARAILSRLSTPPGCPNWYGEQRFGRGGANVSRAREMVQNPEAQRGIDKRVKRLLLSALQSHLFNQYLKARLADRLLATVLEGDLLQKTDTGGVFFCAEPAVDQERLDRGEIVITGPMFGSEMRAPPAETAAAEREATLLAEAGLTGAAFRPFGRIARGARRALSVLVRDPSVRAITDRDIEIAFVLPPGSYATVVASEVMKEAEIA